MAKKIKLTRPEMKRYRDTLTRYERYLPMLKLKQQQLQLTLREVERKQQDLAEAVRAARQNFEQYEVVLADVAGLNVRRLGKPQEVKTLTTNIAGVAVPVFQEAVFQAPFYSLFGTPPWVDRALADLREVSRRQAELEVLREQYRLLGDELIRIIQRVNLFEKIKIPEAREAIRVIRIKLGDEMASAVGRAKIAKAKVAEAVAVDTGKPATLSGKEGEQ